MVFTVPVLHHQAFFPQSSEIFLAGSTITGSGLSFGSGLSLNVAGTVDGTYLGVPFRVAYTTETLFSK